IDMAAEHRQELLEIKDIGLGSSRAAIHLNARRVDDEIVNAHTGEIPVDPKSITSDLVTARDRRIGRELEALFRSRQLLPQSIPGVGRECAAADPLSKLRRETHLPLPSTKFDRHQQSVTSSCGRLL